MTQALLILLPLSLALVSVAIVTVTWAIRSGQFDDLEAEGERILLDDPEPDPRADASDTDGSALSSPQETSS